MEISLVNTDFDITSLIHITIVFILNLILPICTPYIKKRLLNALFGCLKKKKRKDHKSLIKKDFGIFSFKT